MPKYILFSLLVIFIIISVYSTLEPNDNDTLTTDEPLLQTTQTSELVTTSAITTTPNAPKTPPNTTTPATTQAEPLIVGWYGDVDVGNRVPVRDRGVDEWGRWRMVFVPNAEVRSFSLWAITPNNNSFILEWEVFRVGGYALGECYILYSGLDIKALGEIQETQIPKPMSIAVNFNEDWYTIQFDENDGTPILVESDFEYDLYPWRYVERDYPAMVAELNSELIGAELIISERTYPCPWSGEERTTDAVYVKYSDGSQIELFRWLSDISRLNVSPNGQKLLYYEPFDHRGGRYFLYDISTRATTEITGTHLDRDNVIVDAIWLDDETLLTAVGWPHGSSGGIGGRSIHFYNINTNKHGMLINGNIEYKGAIVEFINMVITDVSFKFSTILNVDAVNWWVIFDNEISLTEVRELCNVDSLLTLEYDNIGD